jgi:hypothetical protein
MNMPLLPELQRGAQGPLKIRVRISLSFRISIRSQTGKGQKLAVGQIVPVPALQHGVLPEVEQLGRTEIFDMSIAKRHVEPLRVPFAVRWRRPRPVGRDGRAGREPGLMASL